MKNLDPDDYVRSNVRLMMDFLDWMADEGDLDKERTRRCLALRNELLNFLEGLEE